MTLCVEIKIHNDLVQRLDSNLSTMVKNTFPNRMVVEFLIGSADFELSGMFNFKTKVLFHM